jgi:putative ABC transport system ATP-binding protein
MNEVIKITNLRKTFLLGTQFIEALKDVSLTINKNEYVALMGPSGSGKSTLMNILGCLDTPTSGSYLLNNTEVAKMTDDELAFVRNKEIGFVPLVYAGMSAKDRKERSEHVMEQVGLGDRMNHKPMELSGGQRQRVAIARALVNHPSIILADEPTGNLDTKTSYEIMGLFQDIHSKGNTVILVTHEEDIAKHARRIMGLRDGLIEYDKANEPIRGVAV